MVLSEMSLLSLEISREVVSSSSSSEGKGGGDSSTSEVVATVMGLREREYSSSKSHSSRYLRNMKFGRGGSSSGRDSDCTNICRECTTSKMDFNENDNAFAKRRNLVTKSYYSSSTSTNNNNNNNSNSSTDNKKPGTLQMTPPSSSSSSTSSSQSFSVVQQQLHLWGKRFVEPAAILLGRLRWIIILMLLIDSVIGHASDGTGSNNGRALNQNLHLSPYSHFSAASSSINTSSVGGGIGGGSNHGEVPFSPSASRMIMMHSDSSSNSFNSNTNSYNNKPGRNSGRNIITNRNSDHSNNNNNNNEALSSGVSTMGLEMADDPVVASSSSSGDRDLSIITGQPPPSAADLTSSNASSSSSENPYSPTHQNMQQAQEEPARKNYPYIDKVASPNVTALLGKMAYLTCRVRNLGDKTVSWVRHRDIHLLTVGRYTYTTDQRFRAILQPSTDEYTLMIKYPQHRDSGIYECQVSTTPHLSHYVHLSVVEPVTEVVGGPELFIDRGSTINLTCTVKFSPEPPSYIIWNHNNAIISYNSPRGGVSVLTEKGDTTTSYLLIQQAKPTDSGRYSCNPSNAVPHSILVHVLNGELPAAMHTGGQMTPRVSTGIIHFSVTLLTFVMVLQTHVFLQ